MTILEAIEQRHSVRAYQDRPLDGHVAGKLKELIDECNRDGDLHMQLVQNEPQAFDCLMAHYGSFSGISSYIAMIGKKRDDLSEKIGYYGEKIVLYAQMLGLNSCWVASTYKKVKSAFVIDDGEKLCVVIALGYGKTQGKQHKSKTVEKVSNAQHAPDWFVRGVKAALLAPTALNQQKFAFTYEGDGKVSARANAGAYTKLDLGIAKCHFELGAGKENFEWV